MSRKQKLKQISLHQIQEQLDGQQTFAASERHRSISKLFSDSGSASRSSRVVGSSRRRKTDQRPTGIPSDYRPSAASASTRISTSASASGTTASSSSSYRGTPSKVSSNGSNTASTQTLSSSADSTPNPKPASASSTISAPDSTKRSTTTWSSATPTPGDTEGFDYEEITRWKSFEWFPSTHKNLVPRLVKSGFSFTGKGLETKCISCDVTINNWSRDDNPEKRHRRINPRCPSVVKTTTKEPAENKIINQASGTQVDEGYASVVSSSENSQSLQPPAKEQNSSKYMQAGAKEQNSNQTKKYNEHNRTDWQKDAAVSALLEMGKSPALVRQAFFNIKRKELPLDVESLMDDVLRLEDEARKLPLTESKYKHPKLAELYAINKCLRQEMTCVLCGSGQRDLLMLPCKHLVACEDCGEEVETCPKCSKNIMATVKIYLIK